MVFSPKIFEPQSYKTTFLEISVQDRQLAAVVKTGQLFSVLAAATE